jgi:signal transduction histidine kinase
LQAETAERLQAVESLREKEQIFMQQSRQAAMGEMIGNIAHQWRQPLNTLGLMVQELPLVYDVGELSREFLQENVNKTMEIIRHMSQTIDDFRNFFKPDKEKVDFDVLAIVKKTISLVKGSFNERCIRLQVKDGDTTIVHGYPNEFSQVLLNILDNARDAFSEQAKAPQVTIDIRKEGDKAIIAITDNAGGIAEDDLARIFEPYFTTKGPDKGTGVGLFMAKNIIERNMGGRLSASNTAGGARFTIEI